MTKNKTAVPVVVLLLSVLLCACSNGTATQAGTLKVTDMTGREISLDKPAERVVAVTAADCEIVAALAPEALVGRGAYCDWPVSILDVPVVESGNTLSAEQILGLEPDLVIMSDMAQTTEQVESITRAGVPVLVTNAEDIEGVYHAVDVIGKALGKETEAELVVEYMKSSFDAVKRSAAEQSAETRTVYFEVSALEFGLWAAGTDTFMHEIAVMVGLTNVFDDISGWQQISPEQVMERNPSIIMTSSMYLGEGPMPADEIMSRAGWEYIDAIKNGRVYQLGSDEITRPGPRLVDAARMLYELVYGESVCTVQLTGDGGANGSDTDSEVSGVTYENGVFTFIKGND